MKILVTGATGFVGSQLIRDLIKKNYNLRALVRKTSRLDGLKGLDLELCYGDVTDFGSLKNAVEGIDAVIHMASVVGEAGNRDQFFKVNVEGTRNLLKAIRERETPLKRFIHISSLSVITGYQDHNGTNEDAPYRPTGENYADTKIEAEKLAMEAYHHDGLPVSVLRPGFIFGPGDRLFLPTVIENLKDGKIILINQGQKLLNLTYVANLVEAIELALEREEAIGQVFNITDGEEVSKRKFFSSIAELTGLPEPKKSIPFFVAKSLCEAMVLTYKLFHLRGTPPLTRMKLRFAGQNQWFDISKAESVLGYKHPVTFDRGIQEAVKWYKENLSSKGV